MTEAGVYLYLTRVDGQTILKLRGVVRGMKLSTAQAWGAFLKWGGKLHYSPYPYPYPYPTRYKSVNFGGEKGPGSPNW